MHRTLHQFHKNHPRILPDTPVRSIRTELLSTFNRLWSQARSQLATLGIAESELEDFRQQSEKMLLNYSHWLLKHGFKCPDFSELRLYSKSLGLMGIIDAVHQEPCKAFIIDYKTSQRAELTDNINRQAAIYALLYHECYQEMPQAVWIHFLINPDEPIPVHVDEHLLDYGKLMVEFIREKTRSYHEVDYPCTCGGFCEKDLMGK